MADVIAHPAAAGAPRVGSGYLYTELQADQIAAALLEDYTVFADALKLSRLSVQNELVQASRINAPGLVAQLKARLIKVDLAIALCARRAEGLTAQAATAAPELTP